MKKISILILLAIFGFQSPAYNPLQAQSTEKPDAIYKLIRQRYTVRRDGTSEYNYRKELTLLRNRAITAYADKGETFIVYNPAFQSLTVNECYTIRKDGSRVQTPKRAFVEQLPSDCQSCGRFNNLVELAIVHTALEYDCTIVLDYTITSRTDILQQKIQLTQDCPVERYEIIIDQPYDMDFYYSLQANGADISQPADKHTLHLVANNLRQSYADHYLPPSETIYPTLWFSNRTSVSPDMQQVRGKLPDAVNLINSERVRIRKLGNLSSHQRNLLLVEALRDYVADNIRTNNLPPSLLNHRSADAAQVWHSGCGTPYEKAITLAALLQQAGFYAYASLNEEHLLTADNKPFSLLTSDQATVTVVVDDSQLQLSASHTSTPSSPKPSTLTPEQTDSFVIYTIPSSDCPFDINPAYLPSHRSTPLQAARCDTTYSYKLPDDPHSLLKPVNLSYSVQGLGSISISIKQVGHHTEILKHLSIEHDIVSPEQYQDFRQMMIDWNQYNKIYLRK
ncbi:MAG: DUF3857 domain-containing protein [Bacteroidales bacterium]|nr:DUF3857 domain-containing protein [Bacteroidales bacterium]